MVNEDLKINPLAKKYIITFKPKELRPNKTDDKVDILRSLTGLGDFDNYVNLSNLRSGDKFQRYNKRMSTGRNKSDNFNPIAPNTETIHDINVYERPIVMMKLTPAQHQIVRKDPNILTVEEDSTVYPHMSTTANPQQTPYGIARVKAPDSWTTTKNKRGDGVTIGVIDSGIDDNHPDLKSNVWNGASFVSQTSDWSDQGVHIGTLSSPLVYHGTHVSGTIGAVDNQEGVVGVAPEIQLYALRVFAPTVVNTSLTIIMAAMEFAIQNKLDITNHSIGGGTFTTAAQTQFQQAYDGGMIICCSSGNNGIKTMDPTKPTSQQNYPSGYASNIEVSSIGPTGLISSFSNYGTKTEFAAPGEQILSTWLSTQLGGYNAISGTSMSCPHVSGLFAMGFAAWRFSPCSDMYQLSTKKNEVLRIIARQTADKLGKFADRDPANAYGYGIPNVQAFVTKLLNPDIHVQPVA